jgi:hypothetical protein
MPYDARNLNLLRELTGARWRGAAAPERIASAAGRAWHGRTGGRGSLAAKLTVTADAISA